MKSARLFLLVAAAVVVALLSLPNAASAQGYGDHNCAGSNTYGYDGDGYYAQSYDDGPYGYSDEDYGSVGGYVGYSAPYPDYGYSAPYGGYDSYRDRYAYDRNGYGGGHRRGYSRGHRGGSGFNRYVTPDGLHEDHVRRRLRLFPFPHIGRRVVHHNHR